MIRRHAILYALLVFASGAVSALLPSVQGRTVHVAEAPLFMYQQIIGRLDGRQCPSFPVCSLYARQALHKHGLLIGSWLVIDRLIHEADDLQRGPWIMDGGKRRLYDPLARNDFWLKRRD